MTASNLGRHYPPDGGGVGFPISGGNLSERSPEVRVLCARPLRYPYRLHHCFTIGKQVVTIAGVPYEFDEASGTVLGNYVDPRGEVHYDQHYGPPTRRPTKLHCVFSAQHETEAASIPYSATANPLVTVQPSQHGSAHRYD